MTESDRISLALSEAKKKKTDLLKELGWTRFATLSEKLTNNKIDDEIIEATARLTGEPLNLLKEDIEWIRKSNETARIFSKNKEDYRHLIIGLLSHHLTFGKDSLL